MKDIIVTKSDYIYQHLKDAIIDGALQPNERIIVSDVTKQYGVSPMPVREALTKLEKYGYVTVEPHVGARVTPMDMGRLKEITLLRIEIEGLVASTAVPYIDRRTIISLRENLAKSRDAFQRNDNNAYSVLNREFHDLMYEKCPYAYMKQLKDELQCLSEISRVVFKRVPEQNGQSLEEHEAWLSAAEAGDCEAVRQIVRHHKRRAFNTLMRLLGQSDLPV